MSLDLNKKYWELLNKLDIVTIVAMAPRPGVDFIHSLFDSHPQVLTLMVGYSIMNFIKDLLVYVRKILCLGIMKMLNQKNVKQS